MNADLSSINRVRRIALARQAGRLPLADDLDWLLGLPQTALQRGVTLDEAGDLAPGWPRFMLRDERRAAISMLAAVPGMSDRKASAGLYDRLGRYFRTKFARDRRKNLCPEGEIGTFYRVLAANGGDLPSADTIRKWLRDHKISGRTFSNRAPEKLAHERHEEHHVEKSTGAG